MSGPRIWRLEHEGVPLEVERGGGGAWRVAVNGRERVDGSLGRAAAACGLDPCAEWLLALEREPAAAAVTFSRPAREEGGGPASR